MRLSAAVTLLVGSVAIAAGSAVAFVSARPAPFVATVSNPLLRSCARGGFDLKMVVRNKGLAAGTRIFGVEITGASRRPCTMQGYPVVTVLGPTDSPLTTIDSRSPTLSATVGTHLVVVDSRSSASFLVAMSTGNALPVPKPACPTVVGLDVRVVPMPRQVVPLPPTPVPVRAEPQSPGGSCDRISLSPLFQGSPQRGM